MLSTNETQAFTALYRRSYPIVLRHALSVLASADDAEDAAQIVFNRIWQNRNHRALDQINDAYLNRSARNATFHILAKRQRRDRLQTMLVTDQASRPPTPMDLLLLNEARRRVSDAVESLPPKCREITILRYLGGFSNAEIARRLGIGVGTVEKHLAKARRKLSERLRPDGPSTSTSPPPRAGGEGAEERSWVI